MMGHGRDVRFSSERASSDARTRKSTRVQLETAAAKNTARLI